MDCVRLIVWDGLRPSGPSEARQFRLFPQRLKPSCPAGSIGTTKVVPFPVYPDAMPFPFGFPERRSDHHRVPIRKRLRCRYSDLGSRHHANRRRKIRQRINFLSVTHAQDGSPYQKKWQIRSDFGGDPQFFRPR